MKHGPQGGESGPNVLPPAPIVDAAVARELECEELRLSAHSSANLIHERVYQRLVLGQMTSGRRSANPGLDLLAAIDGQFTNGKDGIEDMGAELIRQIRLSYADVQPVDTKIFEERRSEILSQAEKRTSLEDRFQLLVDDNYAGWIRTLDLADVKAPFTQEEYEKFKDDYRNFKDKLVDAGLITGEIPREESKRAIHFYDLMVPDAEAKPARGIGQFLGGTRYRPLFTMRFMVEGSPVYEEPTEFELKFGKRMSFVVLKSSLPEGVDVHQYLDDKQLLQFEERIDQQDSAIVPVRNVYFASTKIVGDLSD